MDASPEQSALVGIPQIAKIANVGRSAVSNWRKRHSDFPAAKVQTPSGALFDLREVEDWLIEQGKISQRAPAEARLWGLADTARGLWGSSEFARFSVACLVYMEACDRAHDGGPTTLDHRRPKIPRGASWSDIRVQPPDAFLRGLTHGARAVEAANPDLAGLLDPDLRVPHSPATSHLAYDVAMTLDAATDASSARIALFEGLVDTDLSDRFAGEYSTPPDVARLVARLADNRGGILLDPAVGGGELLLQTALRAKETNSTPLGIDINGEACHLARSRFYLHRQPVEIRNENILAADPYSLPLADTIVLDPPYGLGRWGNAELYVDRRWSFGPPPPSSADFAWLQLATLRLKPTGRAAVLQGLGSLTRGGHEGAIRAALVEAGAVEGVVVLPPRLRTNTSIALALWLLQSPSAKGKPDDVLLVDASQLAATGRSRFSLPPTTIDRVAQVVSLWRDERKVSPADAALATAVPRPQILAADASLDPRRYSSPPQLDLAAAREAAQTLRRSLAEASAATGQAVADLNAVLEARP